MSNDSNNHDLNPDALTIYLSSITDNQRDIYISGDVSVAPSAVLAPGVILQAAPDSQIVIGAGACLGVGVIINASQGKIEIESGATLGAGVLIIGHGKIGTHACIGRATTIFNSSISALAVIKPHSIIGDLSRKVELTASDQTTSKIPNSEPHNPVNSPDPELANFWDTTPTQTAKPEITKVEESTPDVIETLDVEEKAETTSPQTESSKPETIDKPIIGQVYINQLLVTLFPNRQSFKQSHHKN